MSINSLTSYNPLSINGLDTVNINGNPFDPSTLVPYQFATGTVDLNSQNIKTTYAPSSSSDLTNKAYVDGAIASSNLLPLNNTWTGTNTFNNDLTVATTKNANLSGLVRTELNNILAGYTPNSIVVGDGFGAITSAGGVYQSTTTGPSSFASLFLGNVTVGEKYSISLSLKCIDPNYNTNIYIYEAPAPNLSGGGISRLSFSIPLNTSGFTVFTGTFTPTTYTKLLLVFNTQIISGINTLYWNAFTLTGMGSVIKNLITPTTGLDGANKAYVDGAIASANLLPLNNTFTGTNTFSNNVTNSSGYTTDLNGIIKTNLNSLGFSSASFTSSGITGTYTPPIGTISFISGTTYQIAQTAQGRSIMAISGFTPSVGITYIFEFNIKCTIGTATIGVEQNNILRSPALYQLSTGFNIVKGSFTYDGTPNTVVFKIYTGVASWNAQWDSFILSTYSSAITAPLNLSTLTASRALTTDASKNVISSTATGTELSYLSGTTSAIQTQINNKVSKTGDTMTGDLVMSNSSFINFVDGTLQGYINTNTGSNMTISSNYDLVLSDTTGLCQINGSPSFDGTNALQLTNTASQYGRTQLQMIGRYEGGNDGWSRDNGRNIIRFLYQTTKTSAITNYATIQAYPGEGLGILINSNTAPSFITNNNGDVTINQRELRINQLNSNVCQIRMKSGNTNIASMFHCNGNELYVLATNGGDWTGNYNGYRPLYMSLVGNGCTMGEGLNVSGGSITCANQPFCIVGGVAGASVGYGVGSVFGAGSRLFAYTSAGMSNSGTSGWDSASGAFWLVKTGRWQVNWSFYWNNFAGGSRAVLVHYNSGGALLETRYVALNGGGIGSDTTQSYSSVIYGSTGDFLQCQFQSGSGTLYFGGITHTHCTFTFLA